VEVFSVSDAFYAGLADVASDILDEFKQGEVIFLRYAAGTIDPDYPDQPVPDGDAVEHVVSAAVRGTNAEDQLNTSIEASDLIVTIPAFSRVDGVKGDFEPVSTDKVVIRESEHVIRMISRIPGSGPAISYKVVVAS
jgi:hypothetical protein